MSEVDEEAELPSGPLSPEFLESVSPKDPQEKEALIQQENVKNNDQIGNVIGDIRVYGGFEAAALFSEKHPEADVWLYYYGKSCKPCKKTSPVFERNALFSWTSEGKRLMGRSFYLLKMQWPSETGEKDPLNFPDPPSGKQLPDNPYRDPLFIHKILTSPCVVVFRDGQEVHRFKYFGHDSGGDACSSNDKQNAELFAYEEFIKTDEGRRYIRQNPQYGPPSSGGGGNFDRGGARRDVVFDEHGLEE